MFKTLMEKDRPVMYGNSQCNVSYVEDLSHLIGNENVELQTQTLYKAMLAS